MRRLTIALAIIGLSSSAFAALPAGTDPTQVTVPQLPGGFVIGVMGDYLQASANHGDLDYAGLNNNDGDTVGSSPFSSKLYAVDPSYQWGWGANIGYIFPQTGNDVNLAYSYLSTSDTDSIAAPGGGFLRAIPALDTADFSGPGESVTNIAAKAEYTLNQVDLTAGQFIDVGCRLILHPNVGLRWASLERKLSEVALGTFDFGLGSGTTGLASQDDSDFSGIGPLAGLDASYYIGMGFGAVAHVDSALLIGSIDDKLSANLTASSIANINPLSQYFNLNIDSNNRVVPVVDAKLGLDYTYLFNNAGNSDLTLEVGWQASKYYKAVDRINADIAGSFSSPPFDFAFPGSINLAERISSNVGFEGPYASLTLHV